MMIRSRLILENFVIVLTSLSFVLDLSAQSAEDDMAMMESMFMASAEESGQMDQVGQACIDKMNNKGWQEISTNKKGEKQYYIVGVGTVSAPLQSSAFADSVQNASTKQC
jgi:ribosomal silencing factor RsfS